MEKSGKRHEDKAPKSMEGLFSLKKAFHGITNFYGRGLFYMIRLCEQGEKVSQMHFPAI